jgi:hypothetical protein
MRASGVIPGFLRPRLGPGLVSRSGITVRSTAIRRRRGKFGRRPPAGTARPGHIRIVMLLLDLRLRRFPRELVVGCRRSDWGGATLCGPLGLALRSTSIGLRQDWGRLIGIITSRAELPGLIPSSPPGSFKGPSSYHRLCRRWLIRPRSCWRSRLPGGTLESPP